MTEASRPHKLSPAQLEDPRARARIAALAAQTVPRPRLTVVGNPDARALIYRAPVGGGKSVLLAQSWLAAQASGALPVWLSLRAPWAGAGAIPAAIARQLPGLMEDPAVPPQSLDDLATRLWQAAALRERTVLICIDDFEAGGAPLHDFETFIVDTPPEIRFALAGTTHRGFAHLALESTVREFLPTDLAFSDAEIERLLALRGGRNAASLRSPDIHTHTGGWPALCVIMCRTENPKAPAFEWPETVTLLREEVMAHLTPAQRVFVENAAMLDPVCAESYDYAFKTANAAAMIEEISADHMIFQMTGEAPVRRSIHPVLRGFLQNRMMARSPRAASHIFKRLAFWHWRRREYPQAVRLALRAGDHRWALSLSEDIILDLVFRQGEIEALREWLTLIPESELRHHPIIGLGAAWTLFFAQQGEDAERLLNELPEIPLPGAKADRGWVPLVRAIGAATQDHLPLSEALCNDWIETYGTANVVGKGAALTCLAFLQSSEYRFDEMKQMIAKAQAVNSVARQQYASGWLVAAEILAALERGDIRGASHLVETARASEAGSAFAAKLLAALELDVRYELGRLQGFADGISSSLDFVANYGISDIFFRVCRIAAAWHAAQGDGKRAADVLEWARTLAAERGLPRLQIMCQLELAELALLRGETLGDEIQITEAWEAFHPAHARAMRARLHLVKAFGAAQKGQFNLVKHNGETAAQLARMIGAQRLELRAHLCQAAAQAGAGAITAARRKAAYARELIEQLGCYRTGAATRNLLEHLIPDAAEAFGALDLHTVGNDELVDAAAPAILPLRAGVTALTAKQIGVLRLARDGLSNKQIASALLVSEDTVKWHMRKIFADLSVRNRVQAISEAERRNII